MLNRRTFLAITSVLAIKPLPPALASPALLKRNGIGSGPLTVALVGSSTPERYFTDFTGPDNPNVSASKSGTAFARIGTVGAGGTHLGNILANRLERPIRFITRGWGGTTLAQWEAEGSLQRAGAVAAMIAGNADILISIVGFNDAFKAIVHSEASHLARLRSFFSKIRAETEKPSLPIVVGASQKMNSSNQASNQQILWVRSAELAVCKDPNVHFGAHSSDLPQMDGIHQTAGAYEIHAARLAEAIVSIVLERRL